MLSAITLEHGIKLRSRMDLYVQLIVQLSRERSPDASDFRLIKRFRLAEESPLRIEVWSFEVVPLRLMCWTLPTRRVTTYLIRESRSHPRVNLLTFSFSRLFCSSVILRLRIYLSSSTLDDFHLVRTTFLPLLL